MFHERRRERRGHLEIYAICAHRQVEFVLKVTWLPIVRAINQIVGFIHDETFTRASFPRLSHLIIILYGNEIMFYVYKS